MKPPPYHSLFQEGPWAMVELGGDTRPHGVQPIRAWLVHNCWSQFINENTWNYVRETTYVTGPGGSAFALNPESYYTCTECDKQAPESVQTVFRLYI